MTNTEIHAIVFDFDGTILETEVPDYRSWQEIYAEYGGELPLKTWLECVGGGVGLFDPYAYLEDQIGVTLDRQAIRERRVPRYHELVAEQPIRPGILQLLADAKENDLLLGVASSSNRGWVEGYLIERELIHHFDVIRTSDDVDEVKPDPALYGSAVEILGVAPHQAVAIEDSHNGMLGAKRAGLKCVAVPNPVTAFQDFSLADLRLDSLEGITLVSLLDQLALALS
jgi:HAD superfamily hydrolase (TIGR01509 family)